MTTTTSQDRTAQAIEAAGGRIVYNTGSGYIHRKLVRYFEDGGYRLVVMTGNGAILSETTSNCLEAVSGITEALTHCYDLGVAHPAVHAEVAR